QGIAAIECRIETDFGVFSNEQSLLFNENELMIQLNPMFPHQTQPNPTDSRWIEGVPKIL
ncbi:MAG: hypothetical protein WD599_04300, partial [Balneolaceae bacterium]